jgi:hypothetical protein
MSRQILITDADTGVEVIEGADDEPVRVRFGPDLYGVTLVGDLATIHRLVVEADRQVSRLVVRPPAGR